MKQEENSFLYMSLRVHLNIRYTTLLVFFLIMASVSIWGEHLCFYYSFWCVLIGSDLQIHLVVGKFKFYLWFLRRKWLVSFLVTSSLGNSRVKKQLNINAHVVFWALCSCLPVLNKSVCCSINGVYCWKMFLRNLFFLSLLFCFEQI